MLVEGKCEESAADQQKPNQIGSMHKGAGMGRWWTFNSTNQSDTLLHIAILILQNKSLLKNINQKYYTGLNEHMKSGSLNRFHNASGVTEARLVRPTEH